MRLSISNIAWDVSEDPVVASLLARFDIDAIDVAPGKYFPDPVNASDAAIRRVRDGWATRGIDIVGMQALLFGTTGLNVFGDNEVQVKMLRHLSAVCRIGAGLGASRLVFGSPRNRDRSGLSDESAIDVAADFFRRLGEVAASFGVSVCLEPNPSCYGSNFMMTATETAVVVERVAHPAIRMQLDTGALAINGESVEAVLQDFSRWIGHVHASEPNLLPLGDGGVDHSRIHCALARHLPDQVVTVEMLATTNEAHETSIGRALEVAVRNYRDTGSGGGL